MYKLFHGNVKCIALSGLLALGVGMACFAGVASADSGYGAFDGPYVGVMGGYGIGETRSLARNNDTGLDGFTAGANAGYGRTLFHPRIYSGLEANYHISIASGQSVIATGATSDVHRKHSFGTDLKVGYVADPATLLYGKVGYQRSGFKMDDDTDWRDGLRVGAGIEHFFYKESVSVRGEYNHTHYVANKGRDTFRNAIDNEFKVGVAYHF